MNLIAQRDATINDLLNRIQASDFKAYAALTSISQPEYADIPEPLPQSDLHELARMKQGQSAGLGEALFNDDDSDDAEFRTLIDELA